MFILITRLCVVNGTRYCCWAIIAGTTNDYCFSVNVFEWAACYWKGKVGVSMVIAHLLIKSTNCLFWGNTASGQAIKARIRPTIRHNVSLCQCGSVSKGNTVTETVITVYVSVISPERPLDIFPHGNMNKLMMGEKSSRKYCISW